MLDPATASAATILEIGIVLTIGAALIFGGVMWLLMRAVRRRAAGPRQLNATLWVVGGGVVFPAVVMTALLAYSTLRTVQLTTDGVDETSGRIVISVTGAMWWWEVRYRDPASGGEILLANEVRVPVGRPVTIGLTTADVIHSFWVPALAGKVDMIPGRVNQVRFEAARAGVYRGQCAEYCGDQHAKMALYVIAVAPDEFERWLAAQAQPASPPADSLAQRGHQVFVEQRCNACHTVRGIGAVSRIGPDLTHVASRVSIGAGELPTRGETFRAWVANIQHIKPGARMPSFAHLDDGALQALAAFLESLK